MLRSRRWVVPPMQNEWPIIGEGKHEDQAWQHLIRNHSFCMGLHLPSRVSKENRGKFFSNQALVNK